MTEQLDIPIEVAKQILQQEITMYKNTRYQLQIRHRVNKVIGAPAEVLKQIVDELEKIEKAMDLYEKELASLK